MKLFLKNNEKNPIIISKIFLNDIEIFSGAQGLRMGEKKTISGNLGDGITGNLGEGFSGYYEYEVSFTYTDIEIDIEQNFTGAEEIFGDIIEIDNTPEVDLSGTYTWLLDSDEEFDTGRYTSTISRANNVELEQGSRSGYYINTKDSESDATVWNSIAFVEGIAYGKELPDNKGSDSGADMDGNVLLMHLNDDTSGDGERLDDSSGDQNIGTIRGDVDCTVDGKFGKSCSLDGESDYIGTTLDMSKLNKGTIEAWIRSEDILNRRIFTCRDTTTNLDVIDLFGSSDSQLTLYVHENGVTKGLPTTESDADDGEWHHIAATWGLIGSRIYVDGQLEGMDITNSAINIDGKGDCAIGAYPDSLINTFWKGEIDELAVYDRALSAGEIEDHYKRGVLGLEIQYKACNDAECDGEVWSSPLAYGATYDLRDTKGRYLQIKATFDSDDNSYSPELDSIGAGYTIE
ncbi:MAG: LamG domain-containing protein [Candidatus Woesearchaeota archaeon]